MEKQMRRRERKIKRRWKKKGAQMKDGDWSRGKEEERRKLHRERKKGRGEERGVSSTKRRAKRCKEDQLTRGKEKVDAGD